jgi:hypothetical protein
VYDVRADVIPNTVPMYGLNHPFQHLSPDEKLQLDRELKDCTNAPVRLCDFETGAYLRSVITPATCLSIFDVRNS